MKSFKTGKVVAVACIALAGLALILAPSCVGAQVPRRITLTPDSTMLVFRDTARLAAAVSPGTAVVSWSSSDTSVATVRAGKVTAKAKIGCTLISGRAALEVRARAIYCVRAPIVTPPMPPPTPTPTPTPTPAPAPDSSQTPAPAAGIVFSSDWSAGTFTDGGRWDGILCGQYAQTAQVIAGAAVGWTMTPNVLRLQQLGEDVCGTLEKYNAVPALTTHWGRMYFRNDEVGTTHNHVGTLNAGSSAPVQLTFFARRGTANGMELFLRTYHGVSYPNDIWNVKGPQGTPEAKFANGVWFRYEWRVQFLPDSARTFRVWPRVYDMAGTLLADASTTYRNDASARPEYSLQAFYDRGGRFRVTDAQAARWYGLGNEGPATSSATRGYWYHAAFALSTANWIGR